MTATIELDGIYGASPGTSQSVDLVNWRFTTDDSAPDDDTSTNPLILPTSGFTYSFWKTYRLNCIVSPVGTVDNVRLWLNASAYPSNYTLIGQLANVGADAGYRVAAGTVGGTGLELNTTNHTGLTGAPVDAFTWTAASPLVLTGASITNPSTGLFGPMVVLQIVIADGAVAQPVPGQTLTVAYDES